MIQEGLYTNKVISENYQLFWRLLKDQGEIEVVMKVNGTGYVGIGWRPDGITKSCQKWPEITGSEGEGESAEGSYAEAEGEGEPESESTAEAEAEAENKSIEDEASAEAESSRSGKRVEKSVDISIGFVKSSVSTGKRKKREAGEGKES